MQAHSTTLRSLLLTGLCALTASAALASDGRGLVVDAERWPALQGRLQLFTEPLHPAYGSPYGSEINGATLRAPAAALFGDYYVSRPLFGQSGGVRVTSGLVTGPRGAVFGPGLASAAGRFGISTASRAGPTGLGVDAASDSTQTMPYLGIGYSGGSLRGGWDFSADFGLAAQNSGRQQLMRALTSLSLDDTLRDLRLTPVLQLGVSYRF